MLEKEKKQELIEMFKKDPEKLKQIMLLAKEMKSKKKQELP